MKKKLLLMLIIGTICTFLIYTYTKKDEVTIVSIGDSLSLGMTPSDIPGLSFNDYLKESYVNKKKLKNYIPDFATPGLTIKELIYEIKENKALIIKNKKIEIKQALNEADILTIAIGLDELSKTNITPEVKREFKNDFAELLNLIKDLNKEQVFVISIYPTNEHDPLITNKINAIMRDLTLTNNFTFIDISSLITKDHFLNKDSYYINYEAHKLIYEEINKYLE